MKVTGRTKVFGLLGHPVRRSLSPAMHNALFQELNIDAVYVALDVHPRHRSDVAQAIRTLDIQGVNLTVPFKATVIADLDHVTQAVHEAQAANVVIQHDGHLTGYNTDGAGFCVGFEDEVGPIEPRWRVGLLGAGGAARAIAASLASRGAAEIVFFNRTEARARLAVDHLAAFFPQTRWRHAPLTPSAFAKHAGDLDLVVCCVAGPGVDSVTALDVKQLPERAVWCDINYWMENPPQLESCRQRGLRVQTGLAMLVQQGALSFELFTGHPVESEKIMSRLR